MSKVMKTMDGNAAAAHISYAFTDVAAIYPITPSSTMAEIVDEWSANGKKNVFGQEVKVEELQSEAGAAGALHGSLSAGALSTTYTASQGLLLMIPNMYKMAGELQPAVFHVSARALAGHALSIFGDHQDVMAARQTGFALLASGSVQEVMDLGGVAHLAAIKGRVPFLHFFDGFRTSHEIQKIEVMEYDDLEKLIDYEALNKFRESALTPSNPHTKGTAQNPDIYFQAMEASNPFYDNIVDVVVEYMEEITKITGREYKPFNYYGHPEAERVIVAMGSVTETIEETIDYLVEERGEKVGIVQVHLYRPFSAEHFFNVFPETATKIAVLDRTKEKGAIAEPLHLDVQSMFYDSDMKPTIVGGRYGLGSKDTTPSQILAVFENLKQEKPKNRFTIGIEDDVTNLSLPIGEVIKTEPKDTIKCKFWGFGSDGTVGANQQAIKIIGDDTDMYAQGYFSYDSKKSGGITISHLRFGNEPIKSTYLISDADFISCSKQAYVNQYDLLAGLKPGGKFLLNTLWDEERLEKNLPGSMKRYIAENDIEFYTINATKIAAEVGLGGRTNMIMQAAFFKLADIIPLDEAIGHLKQSIKDTYGARGDHIVNMNYEAVDKGLEAYKRIDIPAEWANAKDENDVETREVPEFITEVLEPMNRQEGDDLPVSTFVGTEDGSFPHGTAAYEKREIATTVPRWIEEYCIQCNQCSYVCPHAVIRPFLLDEEEVKNAPESFVTKKANGIEGMEYSLQISPQDCTSCGNCVQVCPARTKAIEMVPLEEELETGKINWDYAMTIKAKPDLVNKFNVRGSQFQEPLLEFSGACAGCGETAYVKLVTQLFGDRMMIANATGCTSIWGGSAPATPYCKNQEGHGPSWANSLFEDNAEYGYGMAMAVEQKREKLEGLMKEFIQLDIDDEINEVFKHWLENKKDPEETKTAHTNIVSVVDKEVSNERGKEILRLVKETSDFIVKRSMWIFGGDGWAYDIGFGGVDHVLASGADVNILVLDTEIYSNTGGQSSKSTPTAAVAKFAASGKKVTKKDLGLMMTTYGYVYVAQVSLGADKNQLIKVLKEAESYDGPSLVIAYAPCISHGIKGGMGVSVEQEKLAVESGYWHLYRFDPRLKEEGKNPFVLDSKEPTKSFLDFIETEARYTSLRKTFPEKADELFKKAEENANKRYRSYVRLAEQEY